MDSPRGRPLDGDQSNKDVLREETLAATILEQRHRVIPKSELYDGCRHLTQPVRLPRCNDPAQAWS